MNGKPSGASGWRKSLAASCRDSVSFVAGLVGSFLRHNGPMHAAGLTYFSLLAVVPILCCVLVLAKACGVDRFAKDQINARLDAAIANVERGQDAVETKWLDAFGEGDARERKRIAAAEFGKTARQISNALFERIGAFDVSTFGWVGFGFLLWTVISSLASVETSFNEIFGIVRARPIWKRAGLYLLLSVVLPVLASVAFSLPILNMVKDAVVATLGTSALTRWMSDGLVWVLDAWFVRLACTLFSGTAAFAFFFWIMPNGRVRFASALWGGLVTTVLFALWMKVCAVAQVGIAKSSALYGSFAFLPIVLAWLYMSWQIVLFGACLVRRLDRHGANGRTDKGQVPQMA